VDYSVPTQFTVHPAAPNRARLKVAVSRFALTTPRGALENLIMRIWAAMAQREYWTSHTDRKARFRNWKITIYSSHNGSRLLLWRDVPRRAHSFSR